MIIKEVIKSKFTGVYKKGNGIKSWFTCIRYNNGQKLILVHSESEEKAALKYNILASFFQGNKAILNSVQYSEKDYRELSLELYGQLTTPSEIQKATTNQGFKKLLDASTEFVGVYKYPNKELYFSYITKDKKRYSLGYYKDKFIAAIAYNIAATELYGIKAKLNNVSIELVDDHFVDKIISKVKHK